jgi:hypothetical protein
MPTKPGGSAPPLLKKVFSAPATLFWLPLEPAMPSPPKLAVRLRITSLAV